MRVVSALSLLCLAGLASAADPVVLTDTGVDLAGYATALTTNLGTVAGYAIAGGFALFALWMGVKYIKAALRGR